MFILYKQVDSSAPLLKMRGHPHFHVTRAFGNNFLRVHLFKLKAAFYSGCCNTYKRTHMYVHTHTELDFYCTITKGQKAGFFSGACNSWNVLSSYLSILATSFLRLKIGFIWFSVWLLKFITVGKVVCSWRSFLLFTLRFYFITVSFIPFNTFN